VILLVHVKIWVSLLHLTYQPLKCKCHSQMLYIEKYWPLVTGLYNIYSDRFWSITRLYGQLISNVTLTLLKGSQTLHNKCIRGPGNCSYIHWLTHLCLPRLEIRCPQNVLIWCHKNNTLEMIKSVHKISSNVYSAVHMVTLIDYLSETAAIQWGKYSSQSASLMFGTVFHVI